MVRQAQKLCDEIVEPAWKPSTSDLAQDANTSTHQRSERTITNSNSKQNSRVTKSVVIEKKKVVNKLDPRDKTVIHQYRSKEIVKKKLADIAVNTFVTGPLRCDNDCVTLLRKRDNHGNCKCFNKHSSKLSAKHIQTFNTRGYSFTDKASAAHHVETVSCGTQFMTKSEMQPLSRHRLTSNLINSNRSSFIELRRSSPAPNRIENSTPLGYMGARRWALTKYPARGPDF